MELVRLGDIIIQPNARQALTKFIKEYRLGKLIFMKDKIPTRFKKETNFTTKTYYISFEDLQNVYHRLSVSNLNENLNNARQSIGIFLGEIDIKEYE